MVCRLRRRRGFLVRGLARYGERRRRNSPVIDQESNLTHAVKEATDRLQRELGDRLPDSTIAQCVNAALEALEDARVKTYVPVLTYRLARERLVGLLDTDN